MMLVSISLRGFLLKGETSAFLELLRLRDIGCCCCCSLAALNLAGDLALGDAAVLVPTAASPPTFLFTWILLTPGSAPPPPPPPELVVLSTATVAGTDTIFFPGLQLAFAADELELAPLLVVIGDSDLLPGDLLTRLPPPLLPLSRLPDRCCAAAWSLSRLGVLRRP